MTGGASLLACAASPRLADAQAGAADYAVFTELSPDTKKMSPGWNRRVFADTNVRTGAAIQCDFATGVVTVAPGLYHITGFSTVTYYSGSEPPETTAVRAPAAAGYCRLRQVAAGTTSDPLDLHAIDNGDPSVLCVGSTGTANMMPSLFETFYKTDRATPLVLEHQSGSNPDQIYLRVFIQNSKWHALARLSVERLRA
jgi:hypothetical protein